MSLRRVPLDYSSSVSRAPDELPPSVGIVVPVHGAADAFARCAASLARHTDLRRHALTIVLDGPDQGEAEETAREIEGSGAAVSVIRHERTLGYVASVNEAARVPRGDLVLLNSDTIVTAGWLEKLAAAAASAAEIATATPFSNDAALCSLPFPFRANAIPAGWDVDRFASRVEERSERRYPRIPTGVGFCLYVKRRWLDRLGLFDEAFSPGYGEENDFCFRALKAGGRHVLDDATFVFHEGGASFGSATARRRRRAMRLLRARHPEYLPTIAKFMKDDPLAEARARVLDGLLPRRGAAGPRAPSVLHVVHGWPPYNPAGTEEYARALALRQAASRPTAAFVRVPGPAGKATELLDGGVRVRLVANDFRQRNPLARNAIRNRAMEKEFGAFLDETSPDLVHVHHLSGHGIGLLREIRRRRIPWIFQAQDWWMTCARANLWHAEGRLCDGPGPRKCARCLPLTRIPPAALWNPLLHAIRRAAARRALSGTAALVMGSRFIERTFRAMGLGGRAPAHVVSYGVSVGEDGSPRQPPAKPLRFGVLGSILPHKGVHVAVEAFRAIAPEDARLEIRGSEAASPGYARALRERASPAVEFRGPFPGERKESVISAFDVLVVPSVGLESYGLAAREALRRGVPVIASRRGALEELFPDGREPAGALFAAGNASELAGWVERLVADTDLLRRWQSAIPRVKGMDEHAEEIETIYAGILRR
ncbi:MAG TPA: glycosyltransferase [Thermoanaerobaculia bacterium]|nr:glycosyltransferase [Thermoanaerobaculia bacterium]